MKLYTYYEASRRKGVYRTAHKGVYKDGWEFGGFEFQSMGNGKDMIPFSHYGAEDGTKYLWDQEVFVDIQDIK